METVRFFLFTLSWLIFMGSEELIGQELTPVFENITEGLPSNEVHDMFQDSIGYMWFATDRGICRYNGDEMKIIDTDKDINTNVFFKFFKETETKVWLLTKKFTLFSFDPLKSNPKFQPHPKNKEIERMINSSKYLRDIRDIKISDDGFTVLFRRSPGYFVIPKTGHCYWVKDQEKDYFDVITFSPILSLKTANEIYFSQLQNGETTALQDEIFIDKKRVKTPNLSKIRAYSDYGIAATFRNEKGTYLLLSNYIIRIHKNEISTIQLPDRSLCIAQTNGKLYIGTFNGIVECDFELNYTKHILKNLLVTKIFVDRDKEFWFTTAQQGVFKAKDLSIRELIVPFSFTTSQLMQSKNYIHLADIIKRHSLFLNSEYELVGNFLEISSYQKKIGFNNPKILPFIEDATPISYKYITKGWSWRFIYDTRSSMSSQYFVGTNAVIRLKQNVADYFYRFNDRHKLNFATELTDSTLLVGTDMGLYVLTTKESKIFRSLLKGTNGIPYYSTETLRNKIILTSSEGIHYFENGQVSKVFPNSIKGLQSLYKQDENTIWAWSDNSIYKIYLSKGMGKPQISKFHTTRKGAVITDLIVFNNELWLSTKKGVNVINLKDYKPAVNKGSFDLVLDSLLINEKKQNSLSQISLLEGQKISVFFNTLCFNQNMSRNLEYSIDGKSWFETNKRSIVIASLGSGVYNLEIRRVDSPSRILFSIPIHVSKIWYKSNWFVTLCAMLGIIITFGLFVQYYKSREKKRNEELEKLNLELKLLTSKMNPHFTFNTINSIQYYILKSDKKEAIQYLSDFALLIRKSLDFSMAERITVEEEIHFLSLYVKMENKRFDANFQLKCNLEPPESILTKKIPSMLIQPLVENIILHAGYEDSEDKIIEINIRFEQGYFTIQIIDYGKGITAKNDLNKHKSYGIDILKSRVKIYNGADYKDSDVRIDSTPKGTTVTLKLKEWKQ